MSDLFGCKSKFSLGKNFSLKNNFSNGFSQRTSVNTPPSPKDSSSETKPSLVLRDTEAYTPFDYASFQRYSQWNYNELNWSPCDINLYNRVFSVGRELNYGRSLGWSDYALSGISLLGTAAELRGGSFRLTNGAYNGNFLSPKYYSSGWRGGSVARISTYNLAKVGKMFGFFGYGVYTAINLNNVYNDNITRDKFTFDLIIGGMAVSNAVLGVPYVLSELFLPDGFAGVIKAYAENQAFHQEMARKHWWFPTPMIH